MNASELWGTFSVVDHRRTRAFVAEALIYDRLVIPHPPPGDGAEYGRWRRNRWNPDRQAELLDVLREGDLVLDLPWEAEMRSHWEALYRARDATAQGDNRGWDLSGFQEEIELTRRSAEGDAPFVATAGLIARCVQYNAEHPTLRKLVALTRTDDRPIEAVVAYRSFRKARQEQRMGERQSEGEVPADERADAAYHLFGWEIFVPEDSSRSDAELLRLAVRFARRSDVREVRQSFNAWVRRLSEGGVTPEEAGAKLAPLLGEYQRMSRGAWPKRTARWVARVAPVAAPFAALIDPWVGAGAGGVAAALPLAVERFAPKAEMPERVKPVVYVNEARRFFRRR